MSLGSRARRRRRAVAAFGASALIVIAGCGSSDKKPSASTQASSGSSSSSSSASATTSTAAPNATLVDITITGGQVAGGVKHVQVDSGKSVTIRVTSDVAEELHVHGYDLKRDLAPGEPAEVTFTADISGVFEVELEHSGLQVAELQVA